MGPATRKKKLKEIKLKNQRKKEMEKERGGGVR